MQAADAPSNTAPGSSSRPTFLGRIDKVSKFSRQLAVTRCLNSVTGGNRSPWKAYPGHNKLITLDMDLNATSTANTVDQCQSKPISNAEVKSWLEWRIQQHSDGFSRSSSKARLKLLLVTLTGGEIVSDNAKEDSNTMHEVFDEWGFPTATLSVLLDRRVTCMDQHTVLKASRKREKQSATRTNRVYCIGMRQWSMVWSPSPYDPPFGARGVIMCIDKTWASSVPGVILQYFKTMWMFLGFQGIIPLIACMTTLRYAASALAEDDKEAFQREFELRSWLKGGFHAGKKDLGYTSAQVSWLSSRVSRHRDRLTVTNRMLGLLKEDLDIYETFADNDSFDILRNCICNLADMKEHLRAQARQLEAQANVQLAALFNLITQKDSATALLIARTSQSIAADSRRDQKVSVDIANSSRLIAFNTLRDSASMKAIANVTMVFLPGTFMASVFAMPFFGSQNGMSFFVNTKIWIYVAITIPLTIATLVSAWIWYHFSARSHRPLHTANAEESRQPITGGIVDDANTWTDVDQAQGFMPSPAEKSIGQRAYAREEERLEFSSELGVQFEQNDPNANDLEHWDPMTREYAPSMFAASSFAFTDDSEPAESVRSDVEPTKAQSATAREPVVAETITSKSEYRPTSASGASTHDASKPEENFTRRVPNAHERREGRGVLEKSAALLEKMKRSEEQREQKWREKQKRETALDDGRRRARVELDNDDDSIDAYIPNLSEPRRKTAVNVSTPPRRRPDITPRSPQRTPTIPTRGSYLKHAETPVSARDHDKHGYGMTRSYSDGTPAEMARTRAQSGSPQRRTVERARNTSSTTSAKYQIFAANEDDGYCRTRRSPEPDYARILQGADTDINERGRKEHWSGRTRSGSGDSIRSRGSGHSHKGYSY